MVVWSKQTISRMSLFFHQPVHFKIESTQLRKVLASLCINYIDADLFILDEFQRFRDLIDEDKDSEAAIIARQIFSQPNARVLLLSATPFKAFTGNSEDESGEEHYKEFRTVLNFLFQSDRTCIEEYEIHRQSLFKQLLSINSSAEDIDTTHKDAVEKLLRRVICRTERLSVSKDHDAMTWDKWRNQPVMPTAADVENFIMADQLVQIMNEKIKRKADQLHSPIEFCKSAPYPLSFLDDYKLKRELKSRRSNPEMHSAILARPNAWIDHQQIDTFSFVAGDNGQPFANARFSRVAEEVLAQNAELLLWVPPSLPYYPISGAFEGSTGFSKTLIFSAWLMVPRMLASLLSYEVERRTIGHPNIVDTQEQEERRYHTKKRHPVPQLVYRDENGPANMSNFTLLYPSISLADTFDPVNSLLSGKSVNDLHSEISKRIRRLIEESNLKQYETDSGEPSRWYWAAPLLLDKLNSDITGTVNEWLNCKERVHNAFAAEKKEVGRAKALHFEQLVETFNNPANAGLGKMPEELSNVLAESALGAPGIVSLRAFRRQYGGEMDENCLHAFSLANDFVTLFKKPESIAAIRLSVPDRLPYWHRCIRYCRDGCVQAVLDEYLHLLRADCEDADEAIVRLRASFNLQTTSLNVDDLDTFMNGQTRKLRCHFATELGNQRLETEQGGKRASNIRQVFNSPFRPFVLATTSIGQEGLDFHQYCRKIVHWNLPSNPIDLEQREGRINRFKGHVIRQQIADKYMPMLSDDDLSENDIWLDLFKLAQLEREEGQSELIPFWHVETDKYKIERLVPFYPFSRDRAKLSSILKTLSIYRLAFGQPRQTELVEHLLKHVPEDQIESIRENLMIDLSPFKYVANGTPKDTKTVF
ncbi:ATP-dependent helicase HepA [Rubinisphaera italica]|uniref:ATP-dependent helicase HepA n=2 Tax=Rubinisphaera italica TaxID=2527969 RepID=A0A5C5XL41_9PLAN|nr:ATP-dependent helicase HepA [Rubinisphaera italica]